MAGADIDSIIVAVKRNRKGISIFLRDSPAETDFVGRAEPTIPIFLLPIRLFLNGKAGEWDGFEASGRDLVAAHFTIPVNSLGDPEESLLDLVKCVLFIREDGQREITVVGIAARIALVLAAARGLTAFG